jgi:hypothetical protein
MPYKLIAHYSMMINMQYQLLLLDLIMCISEFWLFTHDFNAHYIRFHCQPPWRSLFKQQNICYIYQPKCRLKIITTILLDSWRGVPPRPFMLVFIKGVLNRLILLSSVHSQGSADPCKRCVLSADGPGKFPYASFPVNAIQIGAALACSRS